MHKFLTKKVFTIIIYTIFFSSYLKTEVQKPSISLSCEETASDQKTSLPDMYYQILQANYYSNIGKATKALNAFNKVFSMRPPIYVCEPYFKLLFDMGNIKKVLNVYLKKTGVFEANFKKNLDFWMIIAQSLLMANQDKKAEKIFNELTQDYSDNEQVAYYRIMSKLKNNQFDDALKDLNECLGKVCFKQKYFLFYFLRSKVYLQQNKLELALKDIEISLEQFPRFDRGWLIKAMLLEQKGQINEAIKGYMQFLNLVGRDEMIEKQIIQLLFNQKRYDEAAKYLKKLKGDTAEYYFNLALIEFNSGRIKQALKSVTTCITKSSNLIPARLLKIDILLSMREFNLITKFMEEWVSKKPLDLAAINTLMLLRKTPLQPKIIIKILEDATRKHKDNIDILAALADLYVEQKIFDKGLENYKRIHDLTTNPELKSKVLFHMAYVHFRNAKLDDAENILISAINRQPVYAKSLNMLAYIYASKKKNLDKALELVNKALESNKYAPEFIDTKGSVYSEMGKYDQALELFERASTISPKDKDIINHIVQAKKCIASQVKLKKNNEK